MRARHRTEETIPATPTPYRGPDRRGVARFVIPAALPTAVLLVVGALWTFAARDARLTVGRVTLEELSAIAATLAFLAGVACVLRWRIDGIARGWWCGWGLIVLGAGQLALQPLTASNAFGVELGMFALSLALFARAILGPEVDTSIRPANSLGIIALGVAAGVAAALLVGPTADRHDAGLAIAGTAWLLLALLAGTQRITRAHDPEAGWIIPVAVALGLAEVVPLTLTHPVSGEVADRFFELAAMGMACVGALGGLVRAAVHHRTRALREQVERARETANHRRVEESFADRLHEMRSTVVAIEGGVATWEPAPPAHESGVTTSSTESTLRAALIAEIRRLRTLVNEAPTAAGVEAFDVPSALTPTIEIHRAGGQAIEFTTDRPTRALGRPAEIAQVLEGLLANAAKYAPGARVWVSARHQLDEVAIRVEDAGPGIDPTHWDQIFERGFRIDPQATPGSGIGLAVARKLVRSQDGDLWVEEGAHGGAAFVISIPAAPALRIVAGSAEATPVEQDLDHRIRDAR